MGIHVWTKEKCHAESLKYKTRYQFQKNSNNAYNAAYRNGWLDDICNHMIKTQKPTSYWTKEKCHEESLKYTNRTEFSKKSNGAYTAAYRKGWLDDICSHMITIGNRHNKCIYAYEFPDNSVYVGLTYNIDKRHSDRQRDNKDQVIKYIKKKGLKPLRKQLTCYIDVEEAIKAENYYVNKYKSEGWNVLNIAKTGAIGGNIIIWTYDKCREEALKYKNKTEFLKNNSSAYVAAYRNGWLDDICSHMEHLEKPKGYWTYERCKEEALKYNTKKDFFKNSVSAYGISIKNGWFKDITSHMIDRPNKKWTYEKCKEEASKYNSKSDFFRNNRGAYNASLRNKWINDFFK